MVYYHRLSRALSFSLSSGGALSASRREGRIPGRRQKVTLTIGQALDIPIRLIVRGITEQVNVTGELPLLESSRSELAETILTREVDSLPLNGRNYLELAALTPGVSRGNPVGNQRFAETSAVPGTQISVAGQRNINNGFIIDGLSGNDDAADLPGTFFSQEVIREFQVIPSGGVAEFGRASSGIVNVVTQSGGNAWHGRFYGFLRNQRLDARNPLAPTKDPLTQAQYGATAGGPIIPGKTFVFGNFEQTRLNNSAVVTIQPVNVTAINNVLDQVGLSNARIATGIVPTGYDSTNVLVKVDHRLNSANMLSARYSFYDIDGFNARSVGGLSAETRGTALVNRDQTVALSGLTTFSSRTANELRLQFTRSRLGAPPNDLIGPAINIAGVANLGTSTTSPTRRDIDLFEIVDSITLLKGDHSIKVGIDFLYNRIDIGFPGALQGVYNFSSIANFRTGTYTQFQQAFGDPIQYQSNPNLGIFVQDQWRVNRTVTVNAGLRYDLQWLPDPIGTDANNVAPRLGIAWAPNSGSLVVRANYGMYFERIPLRATSNALQRDGSKYRTALFTFGQPGAPTFPQVASSFPQGFLPSVTTIDPSIDNAYSQQASLQLEKSLSSNTTLSAGYLYTRGLHLILSRNVNVPRFPASAGVPNLGRPNPNYANISRYESSGDSYYHGMAVSLSRRFSQWFGARLSYTLSKAIDPRPTDARSGCSHCPKIGNGLSQARSIVTVRRTALVVVAGKAMRHPKRLRGDGQWKYCFPCQTLRANLVVVQHSRVSRDDKSDTGLSLPLRGREAMPDSNTDKPRSPDDDESIDLGHLESVDEEASALSFTGTTGSRSGGSSGSGIRSWEQLVRESGGEPGSEPDNHKKRAAGDEAASDKDLLREVLADEPPPSSIILKDPSQSEFVLPTQFQGPKSGPFELPPDLAATRPGDSAMPTPPVIRTRSDDDLSILPHDLPTAPGHSGFTSDLWGGSSGIDLFRPDSIPDLSSDSMQRTEEVQGPPMVRPSGGDSSHTLLGEGTPGGDESSAVDLASQAGRCRSPLEWTVRLDRRCSAGDRCRRRHRRRPPIAEWSTC